MFQIKIFRFTINNRTCSDVEDDKRMMWFEKVAREVTSEKEIENIVNDFLATHNVINIQTETFTCRKNDDRLRDDDVDILYTITYSIDDKEYARVSEERKKQQQVITEQQKVQENPYARPNNAAIPNMGMQQPYVQPENLGRRRTVESNNYYSMGDNN